MTLRPTKPTGSKIAGCAVALFALGAGTSCASNIRSATVPPAPDVPSELIDATLILIGDAGGAGEDDRVLREATARVSRNPDRTLVVFLGDLIYPAGMPPTGANGRAAAEGSLLAQFEVVSSSAARALMLPGNHDWGGGARDGMQKIFRLQNFVAEVAPAGVSYLPRDGCPGPVPVDIGTTLRVIGFDTHWWLADVADLVPADVCPVRELEDVKDSIRVLVAGAGRREVVLAAHHPLDSYGPHGGYFPLKSHVFPLTKIADWLWIPLPVVGSAYPLLRRAGVVAQDLSSSRYTRLRDDLSEVLGEFRPLAFAGGHDHSLQVLRGDAVRYNLVSGAGYYGHTEPAGWKDETIFSASASGFIVVDLLTDGRKRLAVVNAGVGGGEVFSMWLE